MVGMALTNISNNKDVDNENKGNWVKFVVPEPGSCSRFKVNGFVEAFVEKKICQFSSLCQAVAPLENLEIYPYIAGVSSEVVFIK